MINQIDSPLAVEPVANGNGGTDMLAHQVRVAITVIIVAVFAIMFCPLASGQSGEKVAVLYFTDHSKFDSGGGCLSIWPLRIIFGTGQKREKWDLKLGFRDMLNEKLTEAGYNVVESGYVDKILRESGKGDLAKLASKLGADVMIVGDIRKFQMHRMRASSQAPNTLAMADPGVSSTNDSRMAAVIGVDGHYYSASVETNVTLYDSSGGELDSSKISSKKDLRDVSYGMGIGARNKQETKLYSKEGSEEKLRREDSSDVAITMPAISKTHSGGNANDELENSQPLIFDYRQLDAMKFGSDEFKNRTLFGIATIDVMEKITAKVSEYLRPSSLADIQGKVIYVGNGGRLKENEVYINLGSGDGMKTGLKLGVFVEGIKLTDPDTGKELGTVAEEKIGAIKITRIEAEHLSLAEIVEKTGQIEKGNIVKREQDAL